AHRHLVEHRGLGPRQAEQLSGLGGLWLGQLHLAEQRANQQNLGIAADLAADVLPGPALLALDVENLLGEIGAIHRCLLLTIMLLPIMLLPKFAWRFPLHYSASAEDSIRRRTGT